MGGSGGGGGYIPPLKSEELQRKIEDARAKERERLNADVQDLISTLLGKFNERDSDAVQSHLSTIQESLGASTEIDQVLFGGSVAKHTYVDGLSDIDALVVLDAEHTSAESPETALDAFWKTLNDRLGRDEFTSVTKGKLAVTVTCADGLEIQLLPAVRSGGAVQIADASGNSWKAIDPKRFQRALTSANQRTNGVLVPTIKLVKSLVSGFPDQKKLTGYHIEALAVDAAKDYSGPTTVRAMLLHVLGEASTRVLTPIKDITSQSRTVDSYLGEANSATRRNVAQSLLGVKRRLDAATSMSQWRAALEE